MKLHAAAMKAVATKGRTGLRKAAKKAAATRRHGQETPDVPVALTDGRGDARSTRHIS